MTPRDRVRSAIHFTTPDRLPHRHSTLPTAWTAHGGLADLYRRFPSDFAGDDGSPPTILPRHFCQGSWIDDWGCAWENLHDGLLGQVVGHPCADPDRRHSWRAPPAPVTASAELSAIAAARGDRYLCPGWITTYERLVDLCGFEAVMMGLAEENAGILTVLDRIVDHNLAVIADLLRQRPDGIFLADDWGSQTSLMISPDLWRRIFAPHYQRMFAAIRAGGADVFFHSDGVNWQILPDLVDLGVQVFWVDLTINPPEHLRALRGRVCFQTLTDVQAILRIGSPEAVRRHVRDLIGLIALPTGGIILCHEIAADQPWANVVACLEAFHHRQRDLP